MFFAPLSKVASLILVLQHSNADIERSFITIGKDSVSSRTQLNAEGTLNGLTLCKMNLLTATECYNFFPSDKMVANVPKVSNTNL